MPAIQSIDYSGAYGLLRVLTYRLRNYQNTLLMMMGDLQTGKSNTAIWIGEQFDPNFSLKRIAFTIEQFRTLITSDLPPGSVIVFDDAGIRASNRKWQDEFVQAVGFASQTIGYHHWIVIFTSPRNGFIENQTRGLANIVLQAIAKKYFWMYQTYMMPLTSGKGEQVFFKYLRDEIDGIEIKYNEPCLFPWANKENFSLYLEEKDRQMTAFHKKKPGEKRKQTGPGVLKRMANLQQYQSKSKDKDWEGYG